MIGKKEVPMTLNGLMDMFNIVINFKKVGIQNWKKIKLGTIIYHRVKDVVDIKSIFCR